MLSVIVWLDFWRKEPAAPGRPRKPRVNLTRFHGVFVGVPHHPNSKYRVRVTPAKRGKGRKQHQPTGDHWLDKNPVERHASMTCTQKGIRMQRLKRVFNWAASGSIRRRPPGCGPIETCERCAGHVKIIVEASNRCIEDANVAPPRPSRKSWPT